MHFSSIELYNFGIYKGFHEIELISQRGERNITLVGGMNGRGKTTILDAVFLCLYGRKAIEYVTGKKEAYNEVLKDHINKSAEDQSSFIRITMSMDDGEDTVISIKRSWAQSEGKISAKLLVEKNGIADSYLSDNWEYYVEELVPYGIAKFFFFDNEKISQIADDEAFDKIKDSIKSVMGVTTVESLCGHIEKIRKDKNSVIKKSSASALSEESEELASKIEGCETKVRNLYAQRAALVPEAEKTANELEETEQEFWKKGGNLGLNHDDIVKDQRALKEKEASLRDEAVLLASNPAVPLCLCKNLTLAAYNEIMSGEESRAVKYSLPVVQKVFASLLANFRKEYDESTDPYLMLSSLAYSEISSLKKKNAEDAAGAITPLARTLIEKFVSEDSGKITAEAARIIGENEKTDAALDQLEVHLSSSAEKNDTVKLLNKIKELQAKKTELEGEIARCDEQIRSVQFEKEQHERRQNSIVLKISAEADASDDNVRIIEYSTMTLEVMHEFVHRLQAQKVGVLEKNITKCFEFLAQKQAIITSISINPETLDITLRDYQGGILLKDQLSAGEKQMFAISILWGLALSSGYKLPVIIDTPMARLDSAHRSNFINRYLPHASSQVMVLSTDEEVNGKYLEAISKYINRAYTLVYDDAEKCSSIKPGYFGRDCDDL